MNIDGKNSVVGAAVGGTVGVTSGLILADMSLRNTQLAANHQLARCMMKNARNSYVQNSLEIAGIKTLEQFCDADELVISARENYKTQGNISKSIRDNLVQTKKAFRGVGSNDIIKSQELKTQIKELNTALVDQKVKEQEAVKKMVETVEERRAAFLSSNDGRIYKNSVLKFKREFTKTDAYKSLSDTLSKTKEAVLAQRAKWIAGLAGVGILSGFIIGRLISANSEKLKQKGIRTFA